MRLRSGRRGVTGSAWLTGTRVTSRTVHTGRRRPVASGYAQSALLLLMALPVSALQITGDTNRALDDAAPTLVSRTYTHCEMRVRRTRKGTR